MGATSCVNVGVRDEAVDSTCERCAGMHPTARATSAAARAARTCRVRCAMRVRPAGVLSAQRAKEEVRSVRWKILHRCRRDDASRPADAATPPGRLWSKRGRVFVWEWAWGALNSRPRAHEPLRCRWNLHGADKLRIALQRCEFRLRRLPRWRFRLHRGHEPAGFARREAERETQAMTNFQDQWAAGPSYEAFMGRWSRSLASEFVSWLRIPRGVHWLDVGCGTGALADAVCSHAGPASVACCDPAAAFIEFAQERSRDARKSFVIAGVGGLPRRPQGYGSVTSLLALNFFPDPEGAVREMQSVAAPRSTVSACVWDYSEGMEFLRQFWDAAASQDPAASALDEGNRFPLCRRGALTALFHDSGLDDVRCEPIVIRTAFASFDDYWRPFLGGTGPAPSYVASLGADRRANLVRKLLEKLPLAEEGTITLTARAWAVRGVVNS
jgi:SAM-dependent methyltransferase